MPYWIVGGGNYRYGVGPFASAEQAALNLSSNPVKAMLALAGGQALIRFRGAPAKTHTVETKTTSDGRTLVRETHSQPWDDIPKFKPDNTRLEPVKPDNVPDFSGPKPCPADVERLPLSAWLSRCLLWDDDRPGADVSGNQAAAAFVRVFGVKPRRIHPRGPYCYSHRELYFAAAELGLHMQAVDF